MVGFPTRQLCVTFPLTQQTGTFIQKQQQCDPSVVRGARQFFATLLCKGVHKMPFIHALVCHLEEQEKILILLINANNNNMVLFCF